MTIKEAADQLNIYLRKTDSNFQMIGIAGDALVIYTYKKPTKYELESKEYEGFKITWRKCGPLRML